MRKSYWLIVIISLIGICAACGKSPVEDDSENNMNQPNLEAILKDMVLIPAGEFLMGSPEDEGAFDEHPPVCQLKALDVSHGDEVIIPTYVC